jgi:predicted dithiol-disulfide oxidoreductase (DUF899 family)
MVGNVTRSTRPGVACRSAAADGVGDPRQLHARNTTLVAVTRAPYEKLAAYRKRMGWTFRWYSSDGSDFNYDSHASVDERVAPVQIFFRSEAKSFTTASPTSTSPHWDARRPGRSRRTARPPLASKSAAPNMCLPDEYDQPSR